jgi:hypothetical protein
VKPTPKAKRAKVKTLNVSDRAIRFRAGRAAFATWDKEMGRWLYPRDVVYDAYVAGFRAARKVLDRKRKR